MSNSVAAFELNSNFGISRDDGGISSKDDGVFLQKIRNYLFKRYNGVSYDYEVFLWRGM